MNSAFIFDFDGTLGETIPLALAAMREAYVRNGLVPPTIEHLVAHFGPTEHGLLKKLHPELGDKLFADYLAAYETLHPQISPAPFTGLPEILKRLKAAGIPAGIVTGKSAESLKISLNAYGIAPYFSELEGGGPIGSIKPEKIEKILGRWNMAADKVFYVGDSDQDIRDARKAGVKMLAAQWSKHSAPIDVVRALKPDEIFPTVSSFSSWLDVSGFPKVPQDS